MSYDVNKYSSCCNLKLLLSSQLTMTNLAVSDLVPCTSSRARPANITIVHSTLTLLNPQSKGGSGRVASRAPFSEKKPVELHRGAHEAPALILSTFGQYITTWETEKETITSGAERWLGNAGWHQRLAIHNTILYLTFITASVTLGISIVVWSGDDSPCQRT